MLDCPGGLRSRPSTLRAGLLAAFPAEAGITPGFQPIEGRAEQELVRRTLADLMADAEGIGDEPLIRDVQRSAGGSARRARSNICRPARGAGSAWSARTARRHRAEDPRAHGAARGSVEDYIAQHCGDDGFDCDLLRAVADANRNWGTSTGLRSCRDDRALAGADADRARRGPARPAQGRPHRQGRRSASRRARSRPSRDYEAHAGRLAGPDRRAARGSRTAARLAADIAAGLRAGQAFAAAYARAKRAAGVADFDDLIDWTREPAGQPGMGEWVRYKLDRQVDHLLVDEAQDTNAAQWEIIERLVEEFFSGSSETDERRRTLFMVGDFKQAIYGFQGTDPAAVQRGARDVQSARRACERRRIARPAQAARARIPRPVDRRQLPLGASRSSTSSTR